MVQYWCERCQRWIPEGEVREDVEAAASVYVHEICEREVEHQDSY